MSNQIYDDYSVPDTQVMMAQLRFDDEEPHNLRPHRTISG